MNNNKLIRQLRRDPRCFDENAKGYQVCRLIRKLQSRITRENQNNNANYYSQSGLDVACHGYAR